jgi:hypothetical protein
VNLERIHEVYREIGKYEITLDPDPRSKGPVYLSDLIATCRNYLNMVSRLLLEVHEEKHGLSRDLRALETAYQVSFNELLANDERVKRLPSIEDRKASAEVYLRTERAEIEEVGARILDLDYVDKAVRHRHKELTSTMSEIKLQRSLIQAEIQTGAMYGDERAHESSVTTMAQMEASILDDAELDALFEKQSKDSESDQEDSQETSQEEPQENPCEEPPVKTAPDTCQEPAKEPDKGTSDEITDSDLEAFLNDESLDSILENV